MSFNSIFSNIGDLMDAGSSSDTGSTSSSTGSIYSTSSDKYATNTYAYITRQMMEDYESKYVPVQEALAEKLSSFDTLNEQMSNATSNIQQGMDSASQAGARTQARYGLSDANPEASDRSSALTASLAIADSKNNLRVDDYDTKQAMISGSNSIASGLSSLSAPVYTS